MVRTEHASHAVIEGGVEEERVLAEEDVGVVDENLAAHVLCLHLKPEVRLGPEQDEAIPCS